MEADAAQRSAIRVGAITLPIGAALVATPSGVCRVLRLGSHGGTLRIIGVADLVLVPGLFAGRHRWLWMTAKAGINLGIAGYCLRLVRRERAVAAKYSPWWLPRLRTVRRSSLCAAPAEARLSRIEDRMFCDVPTRSVEPPFARGPRERDAGRRPAKAGRSARAR